MKEYYVYITTNRTKTVLYTGVTGDLAGRLDRHEEGENPNSFSAKYGADRLLYYERYQDVRHAIVREKEIKGWRREKKVRLIESTNPYWKILNEKDV